MILFVAVVLVIAAATMYLKDAIESSHHRLVGQMHTLHKITGRKLMALGQEVLDFIAELNPKLDAVVAELTKLDTIIAALPPNDPQADAAREAIASARAKLAEVQTAIDVPEPGDAPPAA